MMDLHSRPSYSGLKPSHLQIHVIGQDLDDPLPGVSFHSGRTDRMDEPTIILDDLNKIQTRTETAGIHPRHEGDGGNLEDQSCRQRCCALRHAEVCKVEPGLIKFKAFFFFFGGGIGCVFPYLSVYFKQLGLSPNQIGIIGGVRPLIGFFSGPLWGLLADRFRIRKIMLAISTIGWLSFMTGIGFVPPAKFSNETCSIVNKFLGVSQNHTEFNLTIPPDESLRKTFHEDHILRPDVTPKESLMESRGWMYDTVDLDRVFHVIMALAVLGEIVQSPCGALADSGCIEEMGSMNKYGLQRVWGSIGLGLFSMITGGAISTTRQSRHQCGVPVVISNYQIAFYIFAGCLFGCLVTSCFFRFQKQADAHLSSKPRPDPFKVVRMFLTIHYGSWLFCIVITGICNGVILGFLFWHLENIGATQFTLGVANGVSLTAEAIMFLVVFRVLKNISALTFMVVGLFSYVVRFAAYALIDNPWMVLPFEVLQGATFAGVWSMYVKYLCAQVPSEYLASLQGILHGVYWGLGAGSGHMIGGISVEKIGAKMTFWAFAVVSMVNLIIFTIIQKTTKRPNLFGKYEEMESDK